MLLARSPIHADALGSLWQTQGEPRELGGSGGSWGSRGEPGCGKNRGVAAGGAGCSAEAGGLTAWGSRNGKGQKALSEVMYLQERVEF